MTRDERIDVIRKAQATYDAKKDNSGLDLNNLSFTAISDVDNDGMTVAASDYIKAGISD